METQGGTVGGIAGSCTEKLSLTEWVERQCSGRIVLARKHKIPLILKARIQTPYCVKCSSQCEARQPMKMKDLTEDHIGTSFVVDSMECPYLGSTKVKFLDAQWKEVDAGPCWTFRGPDGRKRLYSHDEAEMEIFHTSGLN
jgi:Fe-S cluster assembly iron-binding protein IscA